MTTKKQEAKAFIENGGRCVYVNGWESKGAGRRPITKEEALKKLPHYYFGKGFYTLRFDAKNNVLVFNELSENDMW